MTKANNNTSSVACPQRQLHLHVTRIEDELNATNDVSNGHRTRFVALTAAAGDERKHKNAAGHNVRPSSDNLSVLVHTHTLVGKIYLLMF